MAKQGNFTAYQQLRPLQGDISDDIKYWNEDAARKRQEKRLEDDIALEKENAEKAEKQARYDKYVKPLNNFETGSKSLNEFNARLISNATKQYLPLIQTLEDKNATQEEKINAHLKLQNLNNLPANLKTVTDQYTAQWQAYQKAKADGLAWEEPQMEKAFQNGFGTFQGGIDDQGMPLVAFIDQDGDGENDLMAVQGYDEISRGMPLFNFQRKHNPEALAKSIADELGVTDTTEQKGYTSFQKKAVRDEDKKLRVNTLLFGKDGTPTSVAKDALRRKGINPSTATEQDYQTIEQEFSELVGTFLPEFEKEKTDFDAATSASRERRMAKEGVTGFTESVTPSEQTWGDKVNDISGQSVGLTNVEIGAIKGKDGEITSNANVKNYAFKKDGTMVLDVEYPKTKTVSEKEYQDTKAQADQGNETASQTLARMILSKDGERRITIPGTNDKKVIEVSPEDEAAVAKAMQTTVSDLKEKAGVKKSSSQPTYKGLDENGNPIFE